MKKDKIDDSNCNDRKIRHCGIISEESEDSELNCDSLEIVDERNGTILDGVKENKNIFWISPERTARNVSLNQQQHFQDQLFDMIFLNRYKPKDARTQKRKEDPEKIERLKIVDSNVKTFSMILKEAGFMSQEENHNEMYSLTDYSTQDSNGWMPNVDKKSMKIISKQFMILSPILFFLTYLPSIVLVLMFYFSSSKTFGYYSSSYYKKLAVCVCVR